MRSPARYVPFFANPWPVELFRSTLTWLYACAYSIYGNHGANIPGLIPACPTQIASGGITLTGAAKRSLDERLM